MCKVDGDNVAATSPSPDALPPHWNNYATVTSADDAAARARELGANLIQEPVDVLQAGGMAVFEDPTGAALCGWEAPRPDRCPARQRPRLPDLERAPHSRSSQGARFLRHLFGWDTEEMDTQGGPSYTIIKIGGRTNGAVMDAQEGESPNWLPYFTVTSRDTTADQAKKLGAQELHRMDMDGRKIAIFADPQGATFGVFEGEVDD